MTDRRQQGPIGGQSSVGDFESHRATREAVRREVGESARRTVLLRDVSFKTGTNTIHHGRGSTPQGWRTTSIRAGGLFQQLSERSRDSKIIKIDSSGDFTADIEVW